MFSYLPCVVSYFSQLISFSAESSSLDSEIRQSLSSANEKSLLRPGALLVETRRVKFKPSLCTLLSKLLSRSRKMKKSKKQVCKQRWKLLLKLLNLQNTKQVIYGCYIHGFSPHDHIFWEQMLLLRQGTGNEEQGMKNEERGTWTEEQGPGNGAREMGVGKGERGKGKGEQGTVDAKMGACMEILN